MWFKVDDKFHSHSKVRKVLADDPAALALWVVAGSWSSDNLEDGFVPDHQLPWLIPSGVDALAQKLVAARLWRRVRGGYQFHDFGDWNPLADKVSALREKRAQAGRRGGRRSAQVRTDKANEKKVHADEDTTSERSNSDDLGHESGTNGTGKADTEPLNWDDIEANSQANASANGQAKTKQKRTPTRPDPNPNTQPSADASDGGFEEIWMALPRRRGDSKHKTELAYNAAIKRDVPHAAILEHAHAYAQDRHGKDQQYTKGGEAWFNTRPWENGEPEQPKQRSIWDN